MDRLLAMNNHKLPFIRGKSPLHRVGKLGSNSALLESDITGTWEASYGHELVHDQCFVGNEEYGACAGCGFNSEKDEAQGPYDCIGCPEGYEIDVAFDDWINPDAFIVSSMLATVTFEGPEPQLAPVLGSQTLRRNGTARSSPFRRLREGLPP